jgi:hypothetical protein
MSSSFVGMKESRSGAPDTGSDLGELEKQSNLLGLFQFR